MKKALYMIFLLAGACFIGDLVARPLKEVAPWLSKSLHIEFNPGNFLRTDVLSVTFGISFTINLLQLLLMALAIFIFYKTAPKLITSK